MSKKCLVVGGGFAGLSAAVYLSKNSFQVDLIEASPKLGGRAYSFYDKSLNLEIDNGQHILMGCYQETLKFLKVINAEDNFSSHKNLEVNFLNENFKLRTLKSQGILYPFNLIIGILKFNALKFSERIILLRLLLKLPFQTSNNLNDISVFDWLNKESQTENIRKCFWDFLAIGALNTSTKNASAKIFIDILKQIFLKGNFASTIILPNKSLSEAYNIQASEFIQKNGGRIRLSEALEEVIVENDKVLIIKTSKGTYSNYDCIVLAVPHHSIDKITGLNTIISEAEFQYSTIVNIHTCLKQKNLEKSFYGLIGSPVHWIFNKGTYLNLVISDANYLNEKSNEEIFEMASVELKKFVEIEREEISNYKVIKEKRATFIPSVEIERKRPSQRTRIKNLILAGDWVDTNLPSTIESAVKSGRVAAEIIMNENYL